MLITSKDGLINNNEEDKGRQISISVKMISKDNYMIQFGETLEAGEYGFVWVKNMDLQEIMHQVMIGFHLQALVANQL